MNNGELESLRAVFPEYFFRSFEDSKYEFLRFQAGCWIVEDIALPPDEKTGFTGFAGRVQRFHLKACAPDANALHKLLLNGSK